MTTTTHTTAVGFKSATEPGSLDGWVMTCSCGSKLGNSLGERWARKDEAAHLAYWAKRNAR